jgi:hypothetical protein
MGWLELQCVLHNLFSWSWVLVQQGAAFSQHTIYKLYPIREINLQWVRTWHNITIVLILKQPGSWTGRVDGLREEFVRPFRSEPDPHPLIETKVDINCPPSITAWSSNMMRNCTPSHHETNSFSHCWWSLGGCQTKAPVFQSLLWVKVKIFYRHQSPILYYTWTQILT